MTTKNIAKIPVDWMRPLGFVIALVTEEKIFNFLGIAASIMAFIFGRISGISGWVVVLFLILLKGCFLAYSYFEVYDHQLSMVGIVTGEGANVGSNLVRLSGNLRIPIGTLLTVYSRSRGGTQSICLLEVKSSIVDEILALQIAPDPSSNNLNPLFVDASAKKGLFALPQVSSQDLRIFSR